MMRNRVEDETEDNGNGLKLLTDRTGMVQIKSRDVG